MNLIRDLEGNEYPLQATITYDKELNGNQSISFRVLPSKVNTFIHDITEMWEVVADTDYKIIYCKKRGSGDKLNVEIKAIPVFFDTFDTQRIYEEYNEHMTAQLCFNRIFQDSGYNVVLNGTFNAIQWEGFGAGDTRLTLFKNALNRYKAEFTVSGNTVTIENLIGRDTQFMYRYKLNASNIVQENDATSYWTYAKGYGDYGDGQGGEDWKDAKLIREYTSPIASIIGKREAPPIKNGNITTAETMDSQLKTLVDDSLKISVSADIHDLKKYPLAQPMVGDRAFLMDERIGLETEIRIQHLSITKDWKGNVLNLQAQFGSPNIVKRHQSNLQTAIGNITNLLEGKIKLPFSVLDNAVAEATKALQRMESQLSITENGSLMSVDSNDPNNVVVFNAAGLGVSDDGGATFKNAITGKGINASVINTGVLNADNVSVYGGNMTNYTHIHGATIESRGQFTRTWRGNIETHDVTLAIRNGYFRVENPDKERAISFSDFGISTFADGDGGGSSSGTIEFFSRRYGSVNGLTMYSSGTYGVDASEIVSQAKFSQIIESNESQIYFRPNRTNRPGNNTFALSILNESQDYLTDGFLTYGSTATGYTAGLRFSKRASEPIVWVVNSDLARYNETKIGAGYFMGYMAMSHTGENFYLGSSEEIRSVKATDYQSGILTYIDHRAANFHNASSITYKTNIEPINSPALPVINNLEVMQYILQEDVDKGNYSNWQVGVISELSPEIATKDRLAVNHNKWLGYLTKALQEEYQERKQLEQRVADLELIVGGM